MYQTDMPSAVPAFERTRRYRLRRRVSRIPRDIRRAALNSVYRIANPLGLNRPLNRLICRTGRYTQYQPGVCGWCGKPHVDIERFYRTHPGFPRGPKGVE